MKRNKRQEPVEAILAITVGFLVIALVTGARWAALVAVVAGLIGLFSAFLSRLVALGWIKLSEVLGLIVPNILLSLIYFLVLLPLALLSRLFGKGNSIRLQAPERTNFTDITHPFDMKNFEKPW